VGRSRTFFVFGSSGIDQGGSSSILAEIERTKVFAAERVFEEFPVACGAEVELEALSNLGFELLRSETFVSLKELGDRFHVILVEVVLRDLGRIKTGVSLDLDHIAGIAGGGQILAAQITREVDHQRVVLQ